MILIDILIAISLGALFTAIIAESSVGGRNTFDLAHARAELLDSFESSGSSSASLTSTSRPYGNDRIETDMTVSSSSSPPLSISFVGIAARDPSNIAAAAGTPLCAVDHIGVPVITPIALPTNPLLPLTDLEVRGGIAYISADSATAADPDLFVVDIKDSAGAKILSSINTGPGTSAIAVAGNRVYAAAASTAAQLQVIRMDGLNNLVLEDKYKLPPPYATATEPFGSSIFFDRNRIYLGTERWDGDEFSVIDVSNPSSPAKIGGLETGSKISDIFVRDGRAYVADSDEKQLRIMDVSSPASLALLGSVNPSGWSRQEGKALSYFEGALGLGRTSGGFNIATDHEAFAWATSSPPSSPDLSAYHSLDIPGGVYGMTADHSHIYLATRQINKEFQILDRSLSSTTIKAYSLPVAPQTLTCDRGDFYILAATAPVIYDISFK